MAVSRLEVGVSEAELMKTIQQEMIARGGRPMLGVVGFGSGSARADGYNAGPTSVYPLADIQGPVTLDLLLSEPVLLPVDGLPAEAATPLVRLRRLSRERNLDLWIKDESGGPTWSYKDRLARVISAHARDTASGQVVTASTTGNHGAAVAAACTALGIPSIVLTAAETVRRDRRPREGHRRH